MSMQLMTPPSDGNAHSITVNGRTYSAAAATWISVPGFDAVALQANGWSSSPPLAAATASLLGGVVATSGAAGQFVEAVDTTTGALVFGTPAGGGNIVSSGTPVANQLAIFTSPTAIEGVSTLPAANLPLPTATTIGAVQANAGTAGQFVSGVNTSTGALIYATPAGGGNLSTTGTPTANQIAAFTNATTLEGLSTLPAALLPAPTATTLGGVAAYTSPTNQYVNAITTAGAVTSVGIGFANLTGDLALSQIPTGGSSTTYLRGDGSWQTPSGGGNLSNSGTPAANQLAVFTNATTLEGLSTLPAAFLPAPTATTLGGVQAYTSPTNTYVNAITTAGAVTSVGIDFANLSGDLALSQIPTGGSSTTFLRGDGSWQTPAGGGNLSSSGAPVTGQISAFLSSTALQGVNTLGFYFNATPGTDIGAALNTFMANIYLTFGAATVLLPPGSFNTSVQVAVPTQIHLKGAGKRSTQISALSTFPTNTYVVRMGRTTDGDVFDCVISDMGVNNYYIAGGGCLQFVSAQEGCCAYSVALGQFVGTGIYIDGTDINGGGGNGTCANMGLFYDIEIYPNATCQYGINISGSTTQLGQCLNLQRITIVSGSTFTCTAGINLNNCLICVRTVHCENCTDAIYVGQNVSGTLDVLDVDNPAGTSSLIHISNNKNPGLSIRGLNNGGGATYTIYNQFTGYINSDLYIADATAFIAAPQPAEAYTTYAFASGGVRIPTASFYAARLETTLAVTDTIGAPAATLYVPTAASVLALWGNALNNDSFRIRIMNLTSTGSNSFVLAAADTWTFAGGANFTISSGKYYDFIVTATNVSASALTLQFIGAGTTS